MKPFDGFGDSLRELLVNNVMSLRPAQDEESVVRDVFERAKGVPLIDSYALYQTLDEAWDNMSADVEMIQGEGFHKAVSSVDAHMVVKKNGDREEEVQDKAEPWMGHVLPFDLVQAQCFASELDKIQACDNRTSQAQSNMDSLFGEIAEEDKDGAVFCKDSGDGFDIKGVTAAIAEQYALENAEIATLIEYNQLLDAKASVTELRAFIHSKEGCVQWFAMRARRDGTYTKANVNKRIAALCDGHHIEEGSLLDILIHVRDLEAKRKDAIRETKDKGKRLYDKTVDFVRNIDDATARKLLAAKWIEPVVLAFANAPEERVDYLVGALNALREKYEITFAEIDRQIVDTSRELVGLLGQLRGNDNDMAGIAELIKLLGNE